MDPGLLPLPLCTGDAVAELLYSGYCPRPAPQIPGGLDQRVSLEEGRVAAAPSFWFGVTLSPWRQGPLTYCVMLSTFFYSLVKWGKNAPP